MKSLEKIFNKESGFSLVELLVVIVILGILSAIAIPIYVNSQKEAFISTLKSDVMNLATAVSTEANGQYSLDGKSAILFPAAERIQFQSEGNTLTIKYNASIDDYCIQGSRTEAKMYYLVNKKSLVPSPYCPSSYNITI